MSTEPRRFSVFLVPAAGDRRWADGVIHELADRYDTLPFEPHVTVYGGAFSNDAELEPVRRALADAAAGTGPITLLVAGLGVTEEYFRSLFVSFGEDPALRRLHEAVKGAVAQDSGYLLVPHLSLFYADLPLAAKETAARTVALDRQEMRFDQVKIVVPDPVTGWSDARRWQTLFRLRLGAPAEKVTTVIFDYGGVLAEEGFREGLFELARRQGLDPIAVHGAGMEAVYASGYVLGTGSQSAFWQSLRERTGLRGSDRELSNLILDRFVLRPRMMETVRALRRRGIGPPSSATRPTGSTGSTGATAFSGNSTGSSTATGWARENGTLRCSTTWRGSWASPPARRSSWTTCSPTWCGPKAGGCGASCSRTSHGSSGT